MVWPFVGMFFGNGGVIETFRSVPGSSGKKKAVARLTGKSATAASFQGWRKRWNRRDG
jgi:hypothetical protein